ncbi:MAG: DoxX family protein [Synechococcaceae cyanobacterium SM2_3_1]|nr:DoxX family protein [Synechococcaceae cyanobacterium SM2_3_1]
MNIQTFIPFIARAFIVIIFIRSGFSKLMDFSGIQETIADQGLPFAAFLTVLAIIFELVGAAFVISGFKARIGALLLLLFLIPTTVIFHNLIADPDETTQFLKNLAIIGGLLMVMVYGPGPLSLESSNPGKLSLSEQNPDSP